MQLLTFGLPKEVNPGKTDADGCGERIFLGQAALRQGFGIRFGAVVDARILFHDFMQSGAQLFL